MLRAAPAALLGISAAVLAWQESGSIAGRDWLGYALLGSLLLLVVLWSGRLRRPGRVPLLVLAALAGLAVWSAVAATWSAAPTLGREEALLTWFYAVAFATGVFGVRTARERIAMLWVVVAGAGVVALAVGAKMWLDDDPAAMFRGGRLYFPITYVNAQAAFFLVAFWPAVALAARRVTPLALRGLAVGLGAALVAGAVATQSKGGLIALVVSAIAVLAVSPRRLRLAVPVLIAVVPAALAYSPLTAPFRLADDSLAAGADQAGRALLIVAAIAGALGAAYALADRRLHLSDRQVRLAGRAAGGLVAAVVVVGALALVTVVSDPVDRAAARWEEFKRLPEGESGSSHLVNLGSNRYDFWRVGLGEFGDHPLGGVGTRGFVASYLREGRSDETPARAHSLFVDVLAETGIVGVLLLLTAVALPLVALARAADRVPQAAAFAAGTYWVVHASADWIWTFPAVGIPLFLLLGAAFSRDEPPFVARRVRIGAGAATALVGLVLIAPAWLSDRFAFRALVGASPSPNQDLDRARALNPFSVTPLIIQSQLSATAAEALPPLERAAEMEPRSVGIRFRLGLRYLEVGRRDDARRELQAAQALWPRSEEIRKALEAAG